MKAVDYGKEKDGVAALKHEASVYGKLLVAVRESAQCEEVHVSVWSTTVMPNWVSGLVSSRQAGWLAGGLCAMLAGPWPLAGLLPVCVGDRLHCRRVHPGGAGCHARSTGAVQLSTRC